MRENEPVDTEETDVEVLRELELFRNELRMRRTAERLAEADAELRQAESDRLLIAATENTNEREARWAAWCAQWAHHRALEDASEQHERRILDERYAMQDCESGARQLLEREADQHLDDLRQLHQLKRRYLTESIAWCDDWCAAADRRWEESRALSLRKARVVMQRNQEEEAELIALRENLRRLCKEAPVKF